MTANADEPHIGLVVEGRGDSIAVPMLLRRHFERRGFFGEVLGKPIPINGKGNATKEGGIERYVATAALRPGCRAILVLLDADGDPSCSQGPALLKRATDRVGIPVVIVLAERDFEDWIYCSVESLDIGDVDYVSGRNGGAEIKRLLKPAAYIKPTWQPKLTARMELEKAETRSASLTRLFARVDALVAGLPK